MDLIIGAGISGISYANFTRNDFLIVEKELEPGGYCRTVRRNGFVWDYSGHFFHFRRRELEEFVCRNIDPALLRRTEKHTQILYKGKYIDFPFQKNIHQLEKEEFIDCLYDLFAADPNAEYKSFREMVYANLGRSIAEKFLIPYNEKLYACDLNRLDLDAMGRFFPKASREEIILNFRTRNDDSYNSHFTYPVGGAVEYVNSLLQNIDGSTLALGEKVMRIDTGSRIAHTDQREIRYDHLISTLPFPQLLSMCGMDFPEDVFTCNKVLVLNLGFDRKGNDRVNSWVYVPGKEFVFYRVGYYDNILCSDRMSLYVEIGFPEKEEFREVGFYLERVLKDLSKAGIVTDQKLVDYEAVVMNPAYVHINRKSSEAVRVYKEWLSQKGIYSIGRYGSWTYCSIEDNIIEARELATQLSGRR